MGAAYGALESAVAAAIVASKPGDAAQKMSSLGVQAISNGVAGVALIGGTGLGALGGAAVGLLTETDVGNAAIQGASVGSFGMVIIAGMFAAATKLVAASMPCCT